MRPSLVGALYPHITPPHVCVEGPTWTQNVMPNVRYHGITYGNGVFVAGGGDASNNAPVATSPDGITWTLQTGPVFTGPNPVQPACLAFGNGVFVAAGSGIEAAWSLDAVTWNIVSAVADKTFIYFGGNTFVLISVNSNLLRTSPNGQAWTARALPVSTQWSSGGYGAGRHIVVRGPTTAKSDDGGVTWTAGGDLPANFAGRIAYGNGAWVVLGSSGGNDGVAYSLDGGATWTTVLITGTSVTLTDIHFQQGVFLIADSTGQNLRTSVDGINWNVIAHEMPLAFTGSFTDYAFNGTRRYAAIQETNPGTTIGAWGQC